MKIGIDARCISREKTGIGVFLSEILKAWLRPGCPDQFHLYSHQEICFPEVSCMQYHITGKRRGLPWYLFQAGPMINREKPEVFWSTQSLFPLGLDPKIPAILTVHDCVHWLGRHFAPSLPYNWLHRLFVPGALRRAHRILTDSRFVADEICHRFNIPSNKLEVIPGGVNEVFRRKVYDEKQEQAVLEKYQIRPPYILGLGSLEPRKNLPLLIRTYGLLPETLQQRFQLVLAGKRGWQMAELEKSIQNAENKGHLNFTGYVEEADLPILYSAAEVFVFPSFYEGFGLPLLEAMAAGCPVLSSNAASLPEVAGDAAILLAPDEAPAKWGAQLQRLLTSASLRLELREAGLDRANQYSWRLCQEQTTEAIRRCVG
jgi:O-antigen biosynthesis alpha-1,3-rhamnosyltransferase